MASRAGSSGELTRIVPILLLTLALVACAAQSDVGQGGADTAAQPSAAEEPTTEDDAGSGDGAIGRDAGPDAAPIEQRIVKTGEIGLEVDDVAVVMAQVRAMALELGGHIGGSQAGTRHETALVTLRIPADRFDEALSRLGELADVEVVSMSTREEDVTNQVVDLAARIRNLEASEASYRTLLDRAERIEDVLTVQARLDDVRGQIEQLEAQLEAVEARAALSTLTVTIIPRDEPVAEAQAGWDPGAQASNAVATLVGLGQGLFDVLIWLAIVIVPMGVVVGLIALAALRFVPELRRRTASIGGAEGSGERPAG